MTDVLVTGASGAVGSSVLAYLLDQTDWAFTCICSWRHHGNPTRIQRDPRVRVVTHDLTGPIPDIGDFTHILHLAAESHVDRSIATPVAFIENNVSATLQTLEYARVCPSLRTFIHFGTDEVFGAANHDEWDILLPSNPYAASKAASEMIALAYWRTYKIPVVLTTSNNIVGPGQGVEKFLPKLIALISAGKEVTIHTTPDGPGRRHYNPVVNVADALLFILNRPPTPFIAGLNRRPDRYNLSGGEEMSNLDLAELVADLLDKPLTYRLVDAETVRPGYDEFYPRTDGRLSDLGWKPVVTLQEGLRQWIKL